MPKIKIRSEMLGRRRQLSLENCLVWSFRIQQALIGLAEFVAAKSMALYGPIQNEVMTEQIFAVACEQEKIVTYPRVSGEKLEFVRITDQSQLQAGAFGIREPIGSDIFPVRSLDLLMIPGVAFDLCGYRLGYGKGYYDRVLHGPERPTLIGLAFEGQVIDSLPAEIHDIRVDMVITEERVLRFDRRSPQVFQHCFHGGSGR